MKPKQKTYATNICLGKIASVTTFPTSRSPTLLLRTHPRDDPVVIARRNGPLMCCSFQLPTHRYYYLGRVCEPAIKRTPVLLLTARYGCLPFRILRSRWFFLSLPATSYPAASSCSSWLLVDLTQARVRILYPFTAWILAKLQPNVFGGTWEFGR